MNQLATALLTSSFCLSFVAAPSARAQTQWTVDDDGPADFSDLAVAVSAVAEGDVLLIAPGDYGDVVTDKSLTLIGPTAPVAEPITFPFGGPDPTLPQLGRVEVTGAANWTMANLAMEDLALIDLPGRAWVRGCQIVGKAESPFFSAGDGLLRLEGVAQAVIQECSIVGLTVSGLTYGADAVVADAGTRACFVDCQIHGGDAMFSNEWEGVGGSGLQVSNSEVTVAACHITGGDGEDSVQFFPFSMFPGQGGDGIVAESGAIVEVRGNVTFTVAGGTGPSAMSDWGNAIQTYGDLGGAVSVSGVLLDGPIDSGVQIASEVAPFQVLRGDGPAGSTWRLQAFGESGALGIVLTSFGSALLELPALEGIELWLDPGQLLEVSPVTLQGSSVGASLIWQTPENPAFAGLVYQVQTVVFDPFDGSFTGANPAGIVFGF